jgi:hypothetical protein
MSDAVKGDQVIVVLVGPTARRPGDHQQIVIIDEQAAVVERLPNERPNDDIAGR